MWDVSNAFKSTLGVDKQNWSLWNNEQFEPMLSTFVKDTWVTEQTDIESTDE